MRRIQTLGQNFETSFNGDFNLLISCFILEIFRYFETCKLGASDVIYSRKMNYIYKIVNISENSGELFRTLYEYSNLVATHHYIPIVWLQHGQFWNSSF